MTGGVTVVIPTRNRRDLLARTLATVRAQTVEDLEVIVVDDASDDGTAELLASLGDPRVRHVRNDVCLGAAGSRNVGIREARLDHIAFVDDDDLWSPVMLARHLEAQAATPGARWSTAGAVQVDADLAIQALMQSPTAETIPTRLLSGNPVPGGCSNVVAATNLVREVGGFDPAFEMMADWDLWIRLSRTAPVAVVREPVMLYVLHDANMSFQVDRSLRELTAIEDKHADARSEMGLNHFEDGVRRWMANRAAAAGHRLLAVRLFVPLVVRRRSLGLLALTLHACRGPEAFLAATTNGRRPLEPVLHARCVEVVDGVRAVLATATVA